MAPRFKDPLSLKALPDSSERSPGAAAADWFNAFCKWVLASEATHGAI
jgi:hypothetical protein